MFVILKRSTKCFVIFTVSLFNHVAHNKTNHPIQIYDCSGCEDTKYTIHVCMVTKCSSAQIYDVNVHKSVWITKKSDQSTIYNIPSDAMIPYK